MVNIHFNCFLVNIHKCSLSLKRIIVKYYVKLHLILFSTAWNSNHGFIQLLHLGVGSMSSLTSLVLAWVKNIYRICYA